MFMFRRSCCGKRIEFVCIGRVDPLHIVGKEMVLVACIFYRAFPLVLSPSVVLWCGRIASGGPLCDASR